MPRSARIPRSQQQLLRALDDHLFLLRKNLYGLREDLAYIKTLSSELRTLICMSSGTDGLLWRMADDLNVSDLLELRLFKSVDRDHPHSRGLSVWKLPLHRPSQGPADVPVMAIRLRDVIKESEPIYVAQVSDRVLTHELLICAIAQQMGGAHEDPGLDFALDTLQGVLFNHQQLYIEVLAFDAELVLEVGERVLDKAEAIIGYQRAPRPIEYGDSTIFVRFARKEVVAGMVPVVTFHSPVAEATIACSAGIHSAHFVVEKRGAVIGELDAKYP